VHFVAEPFKNLLNQQVVESMAGHFELHHRNFNKIAFIATASQGLDLLELKARTEHITQAMIMHFPADFELAGKILLASLVPAESDEPYLVKEESEAAGISGWAVMILANYVALKGQGHGHFDFSMMLLKEMTKRASSEFAIRFFILQSPELTLAMFKQWAVDPDLHVRRLVSEGSRPRLPWAMRLPMFIEDPTPVIALLEQLKDDEAEYVRRSVANNLNDIAKDHPELVAEIAKKWLQGASLNRQRLVRHACRTLIKNGHKKTLAALGFAPPLIQLAMVSVLTPQVVFGEALEFSLSLQSNADETQPLMIDYIVHHQKASGFTSAKVFKWSNTSLAPGKALTLQKRHAIKPITTRVYYAGLHGLEVMVNGVSVGRADFQLVMP
jgi:3-methyladenine DNA glycosylase AlkC